PALPALPLEPQPHRLADSSRFDPLTDDFDRPSALVAKHDRQRRRPLAVDVGEVAAADPAGEDPDADLVASRRREIELTDVERLARRVHYGGPDPHALTVRLPRSPAVASPP